MYVVDHQAVSDLVSHLPYYVIRAKYCRSAHHPGQLSHLMGAQLTASFIYAATLRVIDDLNSLVRVLLLLRE